jgi:hypothetical protein
MRQTRFFKAAVLTAVLGSALAFTHVHAQSVYKWVDAQGRTQYSDTPPANLAKVRQVDAAPTVAGRDTPSLDADASTAKTLARERAKADALARQDAKQQARDEALYRKQLETEQLRQDKLRAEIESERLKQEANERCARRGECAENGATPAIIVVGNGYRPPRDPRTAMPLPVRPDQRFGPPGFSKLHEPHGR